MSPGRRARRARCAEVVRRSCGRAKCAHGGAAGGCARGRGAREGAGGRSAAGAARRSEQRVDVLGDLRRRVVAAVPASPACRRRPEELLKVPRDVGARDARPQRRWSSRRTCRAAARARRGCSRRWTSCRSARRSGSGSVRAATANRLRVLAVDVALLHDRDRRRQLEAAGGAHVLERVEELGARPRSSGGRTGCTGSQGRHHVSGFSTEHVAAKHNDAGSSCLTGRDVEDEHGCPGLRTADAGRPCMA